MILDLSHGDTQISAFCRRKQIRANRSPYYDEVDIVLHHAGNGKTCWFHAEKGGTAGMNAARVPPPNETTPPPGHPSAAEFWWKAAATASKRCVSCHDARPVMYSPWIGQVWNKVPTDPWGKYVNLGADHAGGAGGPGGEIGRPRLPAPPCHGRPSLGTSDALLSSAMMIRAISLAGARPSGPAPVFAHVTIVVFVAGS